MNRRKLSLILGLLFSVLAYGQESTSIEYRYKMPYATTEDGVSKEHYQQLEQKIKSSYSKTNIFGTQTPFSIVPHIEVLDVKNAGEVKNVKVVKVAVNLSIQDFDNQILFNRLETSMIVTGDDLPKAISKAIGQLKTSDPKFKKFFTQAEANVLAFYKDNCAQLIKAAKTNIERKEYNQAYVMLMYVPENIKCYNEVERLMTSIYSSSIEESCREMLQKAQIEKAQENYSESLYYLNYIDPKAACYADAKMLLDEIGVLVNKESMNDFERKKLEFEKKSDIEKMKILAPQADYLQVNIQG